MDDLNYHHLYYFWVVAKEGTIAQACERLKLAQPTISTQLKKLERSLNKRLFRKAGRCLELTETGQRVFRYADEIFAMGREMVAAIQGQPSDQPWTLSVGITSTFPQSLASRLLRPVLELPVTVQVVCRTGDIRSLLADLAVHRLDVVLSNSPRPDTFSLQVFDHGLGECGTSFLAVESLAERYRASFPKTLNDAPLLLPAGTHPWRQAFDIWCGDQRLRTRLIAEFEDRSIMQEIGRTGCGLFPIPSVMEADFENSAAVQLVGRVPDLSERFVAISTERDIQHPAVRSLVESARRLFSPAWLESKTADASTTLEQTLART